LGVDNAKASAGETVIVVQRAVVQIRRTLGIHKNPGLAPRDNNIAGLFRAETHCILEPGASAFFDREPESIAGTFFTNEVYQGCRSVFSHLDHVLFL